MTRILILTACPHPFAEVQSLDPATGSLVFRWLNAEQLPVDSGGSVASFAPVEPLPADPEQPNAAPIYPDVSDETLAAAITAAVNAEPPAPSDAEIYAAQQALPYVDGQTGLRLKRTDRARSHFTSQVAMTMAALSAGAIMPTTPQSIWDYDNAEREMTTADFLGLMLRYGANWQAMFAQYAP